MSVEDLLPAAQQTAVESIVSNALGRSVRAESVEQIRVDDDRVLRVATADGTWIVKRTGRRGDEERLYGPWGFFAEWVAAETVSATNAGVSPAFLGGDAGERLMVSADLGRNLDMSEVLRGNDSELAAGGLAAMGTALGRLHAATEAADVEAGYRRRWRELCGERPVPKITLPAATLPAALNEALAAAKVAFRFDRAELDDLQAWALEDREGWALIHGDPCLDNWVLDERGEPKLIDFQAATFAPLALDAAYARAPFPTCWCVRRVPDAVIARFEESHRRSLAAAGSELGDPATHRRHLAFAAGWWFAGQLLWRVAHTDDEAALRPRSHLGFQLVPIRDSIVLRLDSFVELSIATGVLPSLAEQARDLRGELVGRWGEPDVDVYPAFGGDPD